MQSATLRRGALLTLPVACIVFEPLDEPQIGARGGSGGSKSGDMIGTAGRSGAALASPSGAGSARADPDGRASRGGDSGSGGASAAAGSGAPLTSSSAPGAGGAAQLNVTPAPGVNGNIGTLGAPCGPDGLYGCADRASAHQVVCSEGKWKAYKDCAEGLLCDTRSGSTAGTCRSIVAECQGRTGGDRVCSGQNVEICGPDLVTATTSKTCANQACVSGACQGVCAPGQKQCSGKTPQACTSTGQWEDQTTCPQAAICSDGACVACPGTGGPSMVGLPLGYCIDSTEVTRAQYAAWLGATTAATIGAQDSANCGWNTSFAPQGDWTLPLTTPNNPVGYVDWCDAYAYCKGVGKRLCGKIGGGTNAFDEYNDAMKSQWYAACTSNSTYSYSYGNAYAETSCNGYDAGNSATVAVNTLTSCQSPVAGYSRVYDLSENIDEWEDSCSGADQSAYCRIRGGSFLSRSGYLACNFVYDNDPRDVANSSVGFRCCAP